MTRYYKLLVTKRFYFGKSFRDAPPGTVILHNQNDGVYLLFDSPDWTRTYQTVFRPELQRLSPLELLALEAS